MVAPALASSVLADMKARLAGWVVTKRVSVNDVRDLLTFLDVQLEKWIKGGGR